MPTKLTKPLMNLDDHHGEEEMSRVRWSTTTASRTERSSRGGQAGRHSVPACQRRTRLSMNAAMSASLVALSTEARIRIDSTLR